MNYAKLINNQLEYAPVNKDGIFNYNLDIDLMKKDGFKPLIPAKLPETGRKYELKYKETAESIIESVNFIETEKEYQKRINNIEIEKQIQQINSIINAVDLKRIRAVCEPEIMDIETGKTWLEYYNTQIFDLRKKLQELKERLEENDITIE